MKRLRIILCISIILIVLGCNSENSKRIELSYNYLAPTTKKTIINWKDAKVESFTPKTDLFIIDKLNGKEINIKGLKVTKVTFITKNDPSLGEIKVFINDFNNEILGISGRK
ncbi:hypothetical protein [Bacillus sp. FJAT-49736]|uniref:hypothetical protein n=1 Tax=Bacillus sp. FJAT-49736 TaxID=2833582 RepID=UPI001BCA3ED1|nr:hypothetical protein [Bacillus sp. FJAT-49736]MBS4171851.1 hypothetical protein [Bacillus sp. FJAT-49736]